MEFTARYHIATKKRRFYLACLIGAQNKSLKAFFQTSCLKKYLAENWSAHSCINLEILFVTWNRKERFRWRSFLCSAMAWKCSFNCRKPETPCQAIQVYVSSPYTEKIFKKFGFDKIRQSEIVKDRETGKEVFPGHTFGIFVKKLDALKNNLWTFLSNAVSFSPQIADSSKNFPSF